MCMTSISQIKNTNYIITSHNLHGFKYSGNSYMITNSYMRFFNVVSHSIKCKLIASLSSGTYSLKSFINHNINYSDSDAQFIG
jgi:hypothetical protein